MLTGIGLRNFKAFGDEMQEAPLSKITLIYGPNSGGKSSIIQALLLLKQSLKDGYADDNRVLEVRGEFADLGSPQAILHKHDEDRELVIHVKYKNPELGVSFAENDVRMLFLFQEKDSFLGKENCIDFFEVAYKITSNEHVEPLLEAIIGPEPIHSVKVLNVDGEKVSYPNSRDFLPTLTFPELKSSRERLLVPYLEPPEVDPHQWLVDLELERQRRVQALEQKGTTQITRFDALERAIVQSQERVLEYPLELDKLNLSLEQILDLTPENIPFDYECHLHSINYLGPLRSTPQRIYRKSSTNYGTTGIQGEYSADMLAYDNYYGDYPVQNQVNEWFGQFEIPYDIYVEELGEPSLAGEYLTIALTDKRTDTQVTLADVGYGINQILPVIIEGVASREGAILCVEQPEIHLHPRLQANIADLMIDTIADEPGKRKQWIVETHSELLILRLQRRIREGKIKPEDVSVLYVDPNDESVEGSEIIPLRMDENGDFIDHWPEGFFDEAFNELTAEPDDASRIAVISDKDDGTTASIQSEEPLIE